MNTTTTPTKPNTTNNRKKLAALLAGLAITGIVGASASSLGGITSTSLGADTQNVTACDTNGVNVDYTTSYHPAGNIIQVDNVTVTDVDIACAGLTYEVVLTGNPALPTGDRVILGTATGTADATGSFVPTFTPKVNAHLVTGIAVTITG